MPHAWYENIIENLLNINFKHYNLDNETIFVKKVGRYVVFCIVYVHDLLMTRNNEIYIASIRKYLKKGFEITDLRHLHY